MDHWLGWYTLRDNCSELWPRRFVRDVVTSNKEFQSLPHLLQETLFLSDLRSKSNKMEWTSTHVLLNISICSNIPDNDRPICFVSKGDPNVIISKAVKYLKSLSRTAQLLLLERYQELFEEMEIEMTDELDTLPWLIVWSSSSLWFSP
jgi:hypothetical protein